MTQLVWPQGSGPQAPELANGLEVSTAKPRPVLVAFGDLITKDFCSTPGMHLGYPEQLVRLLAARAADRRWVVMNSGSIEKRVGYAAT